METFTRQYELRQSHSERWSTTQSREFGEERRWPACTLINHIQDIEREILTLLDNELVFNLITIRNIDIGIGPAIHSLGKWLCYDTQVNRSRLHVMEERNGERSRQAYGITLVDDFPAINSHGLSHSWTIFRP
jgi:hypothetical protein